MYGHVLNICYLLFFNIAKGFYIDENQLSVHKVYADGRIIQNLLIRWYNFFEYQSNWNIANCDPWGGNCDALITINTCTITANCIELIQKSVDGHTGCYNYDDWNVRRSAILWFADSTHQCKDQVFYCPGNRNYDDIGYRTTFHLKGFYKWHFQTTKLFDADDRSYDQYMCMNLIRDTAVGGEEYHDFWRSGRHITVAWIESQVTTIMRFSCAPNHIHIYCHFECINNHRRTCVEKYIRNNIPSYENCTTAWLSLVYKAMLMGPKCGKNAEVELEYTELWSCLYLDLCKLHLNLCPGYGNYCIISGNATYICAEAKPIFTSNLYPEVINATHTFVAPQEKMTCELYEPNLNPDLFKISDTFWYHFHGLSYATATYYERKWKNNLIQLDNHDAIFRNKEKEYGYDYSIYCRLFLAEGYLIVDLPLNFTVIEIPSHIQIKSFIYLIFLESVSFDYNGFPKELLSVDLNINSDIYLTYSKIKTVEIPEGKYFGDVRMNITVNLDPPDYVYYGYWNQLFYSVKAFKIFNWRYNSLNLIYKNDILHCDVDIISQYSMFIRQIYGESTIPDVADKSLQIGVMRPGPYKILCTLTLDNLNLTFLRIKTFDLYVKPSRLCILPYGPILGMLIKCVSDTFPTKQGEFEMVLYVVRSKSIVSYRKGDILRIPYILQINEHYAIECRFKLDALPDNISLAVAEPVDIVGAREVPAIQVTPDCLLFGDFPQEYDIRKFAENKQMFAHIVYYLFPQLETVESFCTILLIVTCVFQFPIFPALIWLRKPSMSQQQTIIEKNVEFNNKRNLIRKLTEKASDNRRYHTQKSIIDRMDVFKTMSSISDH